MPARHDTIIVVRKKNARGEAVEYHTVGRRGPSIWRTGSRTRLGPRATRPPSMRRSALLPLSPLRQAMVGIRSTTSSTPTSAPVSSAASPAHPDRLPEGLADVRARYGSAPLGIINSVALKGNVLDWIEMRWAGKAADKRLDPFKFALSWATGRHPERVPANYLQGIPRFYEGADRAEIIWEDTEVDLFCSRPRVAR